MFLAQTLACGIKTYAPGGMIDFQNIETGSPFMSGTLRNKLFVGRHTRWVAAGRWGRLHPMLCARTQSTKECQRSCSRDPHCTSWTWSTATHRSGGVRTILNFKSILYLCVVTSIVWIIFPVFREFVPTTTARCGPRWLYLYLDNIYVYLYSSVEGDGARVPGGVGAALLSRLLPRPSPRLRGPGRAPAPGLEYTLTLSSHPCYFLISE